MAFSQHPFTGTVHIKMIIMLNLGDFLKFISYWLLHSIIHCYSLPPSWKGCFPWIHYLLHVFILNPLAKPWSILRAPLPLPSFSISGLFSGVLSWPHFIFRLYSLCIMICIQILQLLSLFSSETCIQRLLTYISNRYFKHVKKLNSCLLFNLFLNFL